ncbi:MAG: hypothetical protein GY750_06170 [Lentisphaerae bacterium]|nr:hypothetical protein [Lentisphaerota bacterium]MCP4100994.1 hypothetical protein [Lentisphaerota bacterium]
MNKIDKLALTGCADIKVPIGAEDDSVDTLLNEISSGYPISLAYAYTAVGGTTCLKFFQCIYDLFFSEQGVEGNTSPEAPA